MENLIISAIQEDIASLMKHGYITKARELNQKLGVSNYFGEHSMPMYFTGDINASTVFVMLNPGSKEDAHSFHNPLMKTISELTTDQFVSSVQYGTTDRDRLDPFDLKQAAFLMGFPASGIEIPDFIGHPDRSSKLKAKENILTQKLQLELIPYGSRTFVNLFDNQISAIRNADAILPYIERLIDIISGMERRYVIFGSKQYLFIFSALKQMDLIEIELGDEVGFKIDGLAKRVYFNTVILKRKDRFIKAGIAYSFPRRDLVNAFNQMRQYGEQCYLEMSSRFLLNSPMQ